MLASKNWYSVSHLPPSQLLSILQVVGDVVQLNAGDKVPGDGVIIEGSDVSCDESALTGESDTRPKERYGEGDPFLLSGSTLSSGYCTMLVCAVGVNSRYVP